MTHLADMPCDDRSSPLVIVYMLASIAITLTGAVWWLG